MAKCPYDECSSNNENKPPAASEPRINEGFGKSRYLRDCAYCGSNFSSKIEHKVFCTPVCKKAFETVISTVMKGVRPLVITALKEMRDAMK